jgi:hypothetical protein
MVPPLYYVWLLDPIMLYLIIIKKLKHMKEKDLKIEKKYLLKVDTIKRTWKWVDGAKLVEMEGDVLFFLKKGVTVFKINKEEFLKGGKVIPKNCWWVKKWKEMAINKYGVYGV